MLNGAKNDDFAQVPKISSDIRQYYKAKVKL